jgi:prepilin-type N-terminal cleavage/methylation domain-containing protein
MLARLRKSMEEKDQGFTLIELLVVIIIIGILAAIAIPIFLNQRKKAVDASMKSDLKSYATAEETYFVDNQSYVAATGSGTSLVIGSETVKLSPGNVITFTAGATAQTYCLLATNGNGTQNWVYKNDAGGLQPSSVTAC